MRLFGLAVLAIGCWTGSREPRPRKDDCTVFVEKSRLVVAHAIRQTQQTLVLKRSEWTADDDERLLDHCKTAANRTVVECVVPANTEPDVRTCWRNEFARLAALSRERVKPRGERTTMEPPPPRVVVVAARSGFVFIEGRWSWSGAEFVWIDGHWERERPGQTWIPGKWEKDGSEYVYVEGSWR